MDIHPAGSRPTNRASSDYFTGTVWQDPIIAAAAPARVVSARVAFEPGARATTRHAGLPARTSTACRPIEPVEPSSATPSGPRSVEDGADIHEGHGRREQ